MVKVHTRVKRRHRISSNLDGNIVLKKKQKKNRPKTFPSIESAKIWTAGNNLVLEDYVFKQVKRNKRIELVRKS